MMKQTPIPRRVTSFAAAVLVALIVLGSPAMAWADTLGNLYGTTYDKADVYDAGDGDPIVSKAPTSTVTFLSLSSTSLSPMSFSKEMLYFCKYESGCNYDQGLSSGDGYHAMGFFQFDNRYGLGNFLEAVYDYNPTTYASLKTIGDCYNWDVSGATRADGSFTTLGNDLNTAWHAAYAADPTEFSQLQNGWAYQQYYASSDGIRGSLKAMGIDIDSRADCVKGLCWGLSNLFGKGGGATYVNEGNYYGANWFIKNSGVNSSMSDTEFVTTLCNFVVDNVSTRYPSQSMYWKGWQNRYRSELADCLGYLSASWTRLWGQNALGTMTSIVNAGFSSTGGTVVVATEGGYWDALTASGLAGLYDAPVLMTDGSVLSSETSSELTSLAPSKVYVCGGPAAVSDSVLNQIQSTCSSATVTRLSGENAEGTAIAIHDGATGWSTTAFVATSSTFQDALSIAPYAYAKHCPIFLTDPDGTLSASTLKDIQNGGFTSVYIVGGTAAVPASVETQLGSLYKDRLWGQGACETSSSIASWELQNGMVATHVGVATMDGYWDALAGAALCGQNDSPLVLVSDATGNYSCITGFVADHEDSIQAGYVFGGPAAVSAKAMGLL